LRSAVSRCPHRTQRSRLDVGSLGLMVTIGTLTGYPLRVKRYR
jgi:hypothetical protein